MDAEILDEVISEVAARELLPRFDRMSAADVAEKPSEFNVVTPAGRAAEGAIASAVRGLWPGTVVTGEESAGSEAAGAVASRRR